ncbi:MAG: cysteine hydrolase, partial [Chloroflexi bacterium]|nr:cysteine hydrolase [Chloroflexota bacterium]
MEQESYVLMVLDMQNDFCSKEGVFARNGFDVGPIEPIVPRIARVMIACRQKHIPIVASQLTVLEDLEGKAMGLGHLRTLRPFLQKDGFRAGTWGHETIDALPKPDYKVRKWGYSAMYLTEMEKVLRSLGATTLVFTGIATNGVVEGTARDAAAREWEVL